MTTIAALATEYSIQTSEVRASLDLGDALTDQADIADFDGWTETEAREVLDALAQQAADRA